jgi:hypothetical protein
MKKRIKTIEHSFPLLVVTTDNFTAMRKKNEEKQLKIFSTPSIYIRQLHGNAKEKRMKTVEKSFHS